MSKIPRLVREFKKDLRENPGQLYDALGMDRKGFKGKLKEMGLRPYHLDKLLNAALLIFLTTANLAPVAKRVKVSEDTLWGWIKMPGFLRLGDILTRLCAGFILKRVMFPSEDELRADPLVMKKVTEYQNLLKKEVLMLAPLVISEIVLKLFARQQALDVVYAANILLPVVLERYQYRKRDDRIDPEDFRRVMQKTKRFLDEQLSEFFYRFAGELKEEIIKDRGEEGWKEFQERMRFERDHGTLPQDLKCWRCGKDRTERKNVGRIHKKARLRTSNLGAGMELKGSGDGTGNTATKIRGPENCVR